MHYRRWQAHGDPLICKRGKRKKPCAVNDDECSYGKLDNLIKDLCQLHYDRLHRKGTVENTWCRVACANCGEEFDTESNRAKFCTTRCRSRHRAGTGDKTCLHCGVSISHLTGPVRYCGECRGSRDRSTSAVGPGTGVCAFCNRPMFMAYPLQKYCGRDCRRLLRSNAIEGAFVEVVEVEVLAERDGFICQLCDYAVDMTARHPDKWCATVDHVIPVSLGGEHSYANTQLAHFRCNSSKGNRVELAPASGT